MNPTSFDLVHYKPDVFAFFFHVKLLETGTSFAFFNAKWCNLVCVKQGSDDIYKKG